MPRSTPKHIARQIAKRIGQILFFLIIWSHAWLLLYKFVPVYLTPLMVIRCIEQISRSEAPRLHHTWVPLKQIAPSLGKAVIASEDNLFFTHNGFDLKQIDKALKEAEQGKRKRGASTISQQTAKNVFLWNGGGFFRKGVEAYYTLLIEWIWGKERILEVYLNSIEMGDGIYGAQAVAQLHFNKKATKLTASESALIAASLPNPLHYNSSAPSSYLKRRKTKILWLMPRINYPLK